MPRQQKNNYVSFIRRYCFFALCVALVVCACPLATFAQSDTTPGIDLIILLDQSGSMSGRRCSDDSAIPATDPSERRVYTARYFIDYLSFDSRFVNPQRVNRAVVIGFGSPTKTHLLVNLTPLDEQRAVEQAKERIVGENLCDTSFISALELVREVFPPATDVELEDGFRRRMIIVITDGTPYETEKEEAEWTYNQYFQEISDYYTKNLGANYYPLYVIGIDESDTYWPDVGPRWKAFAADAFKVKRIEEVDAQLAAFLCPFLGKTGAGRDCRLQDIGFHFVEPYAKTVSFSFFKYREDSEINLHIPDPNGIGAEVADSNSQILEKTKTTRHEFYAIRKPLPGCWLSAKTGTGRVDVSVDVAFSDMQMVAPSEPHPNVAPLQFLFELKDQDSGEYFPEIPDFPVSFAATLRGPDGSEQLIDIRRKPGVDGVYESVNVPELAAPGTYNLEIQADVVVPPTAPRDSQPEAPAICSEGGLVTISTGMFPVEVFSPAIKILSPATPYLQYKPIENLVLVFTDQNGKAIAMPETTPWFFEVSTVSPSGASLQLPPPSWDSGFYRITEPLVLSETGQYDVVVIAYGSAGKVLFRGETYFETAQNVTLERPALTYPMLMPLSSIVVQLRDLSGNEVAADEQYPLQLKATMIGPGGAQEEMPLDPTGEIGRYQAPVDWVFEETGSYELTVTAAYEKLKAGMSPKEQVAFVTRYFIEASPTLPSFYVLHPDQGKSVKENFYALHGGFPDLFRPLPMTIQVQLRQGEKPARARDLFSGDTNQLFTVTVKNPGGQVLVQDLPLREAIDGNGSLFAADLPQIQMEGTFTATLRLGGRLRDGTDYRNLLPDVVVSFHRGETRLYRAVLWTGRVLAAAVALVVLFFMGSFAWNLLPPYPRGWLIAKETGKVLGGEDLFKQALTRRRKRIILKGDTVRSLNLKRVQITRIVRPLSRGKEKEGIKLKAFGKDSKIPAATGSLFANEKPIPCAQKDNSDRKYEFRYEGIQRKEK